ncbi:MAG: FecR domain-containing protein [Planctomycetes bacterium]|nr:FecR domain-containing protein [Planctomycetota bacterium]
MTWKSDSEIREYVRGGLDRKGTDRIERRALADRGTQARLDALRHQAIALRQAFTFPPFDMSRIQVGVRARSPYRAMGIPPAAALWLQIAGMAALLFLLHRTGAYVAPPDVMLERSEGRVLLDSRPLSVSRSKRLVMNQEVQTSPGAQATLQLDFANRVVIAPDSTLVVLEPREGVRQVVALAKGEIWARFAAAGQKFAVTFGRGQYEISGTTAEFDLVTGDRALAMLPLNLAGGADAAPLAVLRVFRGSVNARQGYSQGQAVNRDQWMVFYGKASPVVGEQGNENFKLLRLDQTERFKDDLHWLTTEIYPLRAENSTLELERRLHKLAQALLEYRERYVVRIGRDEIYAFEREFEAELSKNVPEAQKRIDENKTLPDDQLPPKGPLRISDHDLVASAPLMREIVARWVSRADSFATLGSAAKTLLGRAQILETEVNLREQELTKAIALKNDLDKLIKRIGEDNAEIEKLKADPYFDLDGSKRKALDLLLEDQRKIEKAAGEARSKLELVRFKLNGFESKIDDGKRARVPLAAAVTDKQKTVDEISARQKANPYTAEKLAQAKELVEGLIIALEKKVIPALETAEAQLKLAKARLTEAKKKAEGAKAEFDQLEKQDQDLRVAAADRKSEAEQADAELKKAEKTVEEIQKKIDALPEKDRAKSPLQEDLKKAKVVEEKARGAKNKADESLNLAELSLTNAEKALGEAWQKQKDCNAEVVTTEGKVAEWEAKVSEGKQELASQKASVADAEAAQKAQEDAKAELEVLAVQWGEAADVLSKAQFALEDQDIALKKLEDDATPLRDELAGLLAAVDAGDKAKDEIKRLDTEKQKSVALDQEIAKRGAARDLIQASVDEMKTRPLIVNYGKLQADFEKVHAEHAGIEYLRARALDEDNREHQEQLAALDRYNEAAVKAQVQAVALLDGFCAPYRGFNLAASEADALVAKSKLMEALWNLYYSGEPVILPDGRVQQCYYVVAEAGSNADALRDLDQRWAVALATVLDRERYEAAGKLSAADLAPPQRK